MHMGWIAINSFSLECYSRKYVVEVKTSLHPEEDVEHAYAGDRRGAVSRDGHHDEGTVIHAYAPSTHPFSKSIHVFSRQLTR